MPSSQSKHPLTVPLRTVPSPYIIEDIIDPFLDYLYKAKLYETLATGSPGTDIILNLADAYASLSEDLFWIENDTYDEALKAFPLFVEYVTHTKLGLKDLYNVSQIVENYFDDDPPNGNAPKHLDWLTGSIQALTNLFHQDIYKNAIYAALEDKTRKDFFHLISMANWFYGENYFDLFFSFALCQPLRALNNAY